MTVPPPHSPASSESTSPQPLTEPPADPVTKALAEAQAAGDETGEAVLHLWQELRELLRGKRHEAALLRLERWHKERREDAELEGLDAPPVPTTRAAAAVLTALTDPALPAHLDALARVKRWQTPEEAASALAAALGHDLTRAEAHNLLGVLAAETGQTEQAAAAFASALAADPGHYRALTNRAGLAAERGNDTAAEADLRRALELAPEHHAAHQNLAVLLRRQGKRDEAVQALKKAQRLDARQVNARGQDQARRELAGLPRVPSTLWLALGLLLFFGWLWLSGGRAAV